MRKVNFLILLILFSSLLSYGQYVPSYGQYMYDGSAINPAYTGTREVFSLSIFYRNQMVGFNGTPNTQSISGHAPLKNNKIAIGFSLVHTSIGVSRDIGIFNNYSYRLKLGPGKLSLGLGIGMFCVTNKWSDIITKEDGDEEFMNDSPTFIMPDFSAGVYYYTRRFFVGFSIPYFLSYNEDNLFSRFRFDHDFSEYNYFLTGGYVFNLSQNIKLKPSMLIIYNTERKMPIDFNLSASYKEVFWIGGSYKYNNAILGLIGFKINSQFSAGYCFEFYISNLSKYYGTTHEIIVRYEFGYEIEAVNPRVF